MSSAAKTSLTYDNWRFFQWHQEFADIVPAIPEDGTFDGNWNCLIDAVESEYDKSSLRRSQGFIHAAMKLTERLSEFPEVQRIFLFGSLAKPPYREQRRYKPKIWAFHEPKDIDLAIWLSSFTNLGKMRRILAGLVPSLHKKAPGICEGSFELFVFDSQSSKYLGRVCHYKQCPYNDSNCRIEGCGKPPHLRIDPDFTIRPDAVSRINSQVLFERTPATLPSSSNLYTGFTALLPEELMEKLIDSKDVRIERIVSTGHASPPGFWYDQSESEWVVILQGEAVLEFELEKRRMVPGDFTLIPPHCKHRVFSTSMKEPTVWLAVFFGKERKGKKKAP